MKPIREKDHNVKKYSKEYSTGTTVPKFQTVRKWDFFVFCFLKKSTCHSFQNSEVIHDLRFGGQRDEG